MEDERRCGSYEVRLGELAPQEPTVWRRAGVDCGQRGDPRFSYRMKLGRETIWLDPIEFRILRFLASRPYRACSRYRIARAVSTHCDRVCPEMLDRHIARLRHALGFYHDYIQRVQGIGYRFRA